MRFAEVFLRLGSALVAWMMLFAYTLWLAAAHVVDCGPDGDEMYRLLLGLAPFTIAFAFLVRVTRPFDEIHRMLRWLGVPLSLLLILDARTVWGAASRVYVDATGLCGDGLGGQWEQAWVPVQVVTMLVVAALVAREMKQPD